MHFKVVLNMNRKYIFLLFPILVYAWVWKYVSILLNVAEFKPHLTANRLITVIFSVLFFLIIFN